MRPKQSDIDKIIESLIYSFLIYLVFLLVYGGLLPITVLVSGAKDVKTYTFSIHNRQVTFLVGVSLTLGLILGVANTKDWFGRFWRWARISQRTTRISVWNDVFHEQGGVVQIGLADGRRVMGWVQHYSDDPNEGGLFLQKAAWIDADHKRISVDGPGILITKEAKIEYVEFLNHQVDQPAEPPKQAMDSAARRGSTRAKKRAYKAR